jgi:cytoskeletal protein CcmA (bactofilin family)
MFNKKPNEREYTGNPPTTPPPYAPEHPTNYGTTPTATTTETTPSTAPAAGTFLADGTSFTGKAQINGTMRIEGTAEGSLEATDSIVVGKTGQVKANLKTRRAVLNGRFNGKIEATDRVEMQTGSRIEADIHAKNMVMEDGVQYSGNCKVGQ